MPYAFLRQCAMTYHLRVGPEPTHIALIAAVVDRYAPGTHSSVAQVCNLRRKGDRIACNCPCMAEKTQRLFLLAAGNTPRFPLPHTYRQRGYTRSSDSRTAGDCRIMPWRCLSRQTIMEKIAGGASAQSLNACITAGAVSEGAPPRTLATAETAESHADASEPSGWRLVAEAGVVGVLLLGRVPSRE